MKIDVRDGVDIFGKKGNDFVEISIFAEEDNPRWGENPTTIACWHKRYELGDDVQCSPEEFWNYLALSKGKSIKECQEKIKDDYAWLPIWLYDHSGITMQASEENPFHDRWDSCMVGWGIVSRKSVYENMGFSEDWKKDGEWLIKEETKRYDYYLRGEVYGIEVIVSSDGDVWTWADSCGRLCGAEEVEEKLNEYWLQDFVEDRE